MYVAFMVHFQIIILAKWKLLRLSSALVFQIQVFSAASRLSFARRAAHFAKFSKTGNCQAKELY